MKTVFVMVSVLAALPMLAQQGAADANYFDSYFLDELAQQEQRHQHHRNMEYSAAINNTDIQYQRCEWTVNPADDYISGAITTYFQATDAIVTIVEFDMSDSLQVDSIKRNGVLLGYSRPGGDVLQINLPVALSQGQRDSVTVYYQGRPGATGFGSFVAGSHAGVPVIWTLSEPYGAKDWWPCKQTLNDKIDSLDVIVHCPAAYRAASNGLLVQETTAGGQKRAHWRHRYPIAAYLVCFAVTNYAAYYDYVPIGSDTLPVLNYVYPEDSVNAVAGTANIVAQMQLYDTLFGAYPFSAEKYGHAQFGWGGGMEHQTMTFVSGWGFELLAHELAHQWFGDKITCGSWEDIWLNEGFATYLSGLCYEHILPIYWMPFKETRILNITSQPDGSVWCSDTTSVGRIFSGRLSYAKGAMILHTLRWVLGDSAFFGGIRQYLQDPNLAYGYARTADLKAHLEAAGGQNLSWYFDDWFTGQGYPSYQIAWSQNASQTVSLTVTQTQSHASVPFYELPIPIYFSDGTQDTTVVLAHDFSGQTFTVQLPFQVTTVAFDPERWIISKNNTVLESTGTTTVPAPVLSVQIAPNPAQSTFTVYTEGAAQEDMLLEIKDLSGRNYYTVSIINKVQMVDIAALPAGVYLLQCTTPTGKRQTEKLVKW